MLLFHYIYDTTIYHCEKSYANLRDQVVYSVYFRGIPRNFSRFWSLPRKITFVQLFLQFIFCLCSGRICALRNLVLLWVCKMFVPTPRNLIKLYYISWSLHFSANWDKFFWRMGALALSLSEKFNFPARISYLSLVRFTHADCRVLSLSWRYYVQYTTTKKKFGNPINYMLNYNLKSDQTEV